MNIPSGIFVKGQRRCLFHDELCEEVDDQKTKVHFTFCQCTVCKEIYVLMNTDNLLCFSIKNILVGTPNSRSEFLFIGKLKGFQFSELSMDNGLLDEVQLAISHVMNVTITVPQFEINFDNREKLYDKLNKYLLFS